MYTGSTQSDTLQMRNEIISKIPDYIRDEAVTYGWWPLIPIMNDLVNHGHVKDYKSQNNIKMYGKTKQGIILNAIPVIPWYKGERGPWSGVYWGYKNGFLAMAQFWWGLPDGEVSIKDVVHIESNLTTYYVVDGRPTNDKAQFAGETFMPTIFPAPLWERRSCSFMSGINFCKFAEAGDLRLIWQPRQDGYYYLDPKFIHSFPAPIVKKENYTSSIIYVPTTKDIADWLKSYNTYSYHAEEHEKITATLEVIEGIRIITLFGPMRKIDDPNIYKKTLSAVDGWQKLATNLLPGIGPSITAITLAITTTTAPGTTQAWIESELYATEEIYPSKDAQTMTQAEVSELDRWIELNLAEIERLGLSLTLLRQMSLLEAQNALLKAQADGKKVGMKWGMIGLGAVVVAGVTYVATRKKKKPKNKKK